MANYNLASSTNFKLEVPDDGNMLTYFIQSVTVPGVQVGDISAPYKNVNTYWQDNRIDFDPLNFQFLVDEDLKNWEFIYGWMLAQAHSEKPKNYMKDITLHLLNNNKLQGRVIRYKNAFPTMLASLMYNSADMDTTAQTCTADFRYQYFEIVR